MSKHPRKVRIHDLSASTVYVVERWQDAHDDTDRSAAQEAFRTGDTITMGRVIAEPVSRFEDYSLQS